MPTANKIKYGIKNVYYAKATMSADNVPTYDTPVRLPGAVSLSLDAQGDNTEFYADNIVYWVGNGNSGYEGDFELAYVPDAFRKDILGEFEDTNKVLFEDINTEVQHFALLFQFEGDQNAIRHVLYNCTCSRPAVAGQTKEESIEPQTETLTITANSASIGEHELVKARTTADTTSGTYAAWYEAVYEPSTTPVTT